jgi:hypothetical protein
MTEKKIAQMAFFQMIVLCSIFFIMPQLVDKVVFNVVVGPIHSRINENIPNPIRIIMPPEITVGELLDFALEQKQPEGMSHQIFNVALQILNNPNTDQRDPEAMEMFRLFEHPNLIAIRDYKLFTIPDVEFVVIVVNLFLIIAFAIILRYYRDLRLFKLPDKAKKFVSSFFLVAMLSIILFYNIFVAAIFLLIPIANMFSKLPNNLFYLVIGVMSIFLLVQGQITIGMSIVFLIIYYYYLKVMEVRE